MPSEGRDGRNYMLMCPFCGLATESAHETQAACIEALQTEISRVREIVNKVKDDQEPAARPALRVTTADPNPPKPKS